MKLQLHLLFRIVAVAFSCLLLSGGLLLYRGDREARHAVQVAADQMRQHLELQLLKLNTGIGNSNPFPDFDFWQPQLAGTCVEFTPAGPGTPRQSCSDADPLAPAPQWFGRLYQVFFTPAVPAARVLVYHRRAYGTLTLRPSARWQLAETWAQLRALMELSGVTVLSVCLLVVVSIQRALYPAGVIVAGLRAIQQGDLDRRLPIFRLHEWRNIAQAVNQLTAGQQRLLNERQALAVRLMGLQEEERAGLARELHDEFGQSLAAINALALAICQGAGSRCPELAADAERIRVVSQHMLANIRDLLRRLRPAELEELGLEASLRSLIAGWRRHRQNLHEYQLVIAGDCGALPESVSVALFRVTQEGLTNVAKHAAATRVAVELEVSASEVRLKIEDDGRAVEVPKNSGIGLLGMRERVTALHGRMNLAIGQPHGLVIDVWLPLMADRGPTP